MESSKLTVIIPTLNEERNIGRLVDRIHELLPDSSILVVDDGSTDETQKIVRSKETNVRLLDRSSEEVKGLSISVRDGIYGCDSDFFMVIDGDFQHPPDALMEALTCFQNGGQLVIGYRIKVEDWPFLRRLMSWGAQTLANTVLFIRGKPRPKDIMSGFFGGQTSFVKDILDNADITLKGYKIMFEILKHSPRDTQIEQFGYIFKNREHGTSKIGRKQILIFIKSLFL